MPVSCAGDVGDGAVSEKDTGVDVDRYSADDACGGDDDDD